MGDGIPDVLQSITSSSSSSSVVQVGWYTSPILHQWNRTTSNSFTLNMVQGHHLQLRSHPPLFCNFKQFNIKLAAAHPIIQKDVDRLLAKGATESSSSDGGFYSNMLFLSILVVSGPYLPLSRLIVICASLLLRCPPLAMYGNLYNVVIMLSPLI